MNSTPIDQKTHALHVDLGERSYPIYIGQGLIGAAQPLARHLAGTQVLVVTNETVAPLHLDTLLSGLGDHPVETVVLPDGERYKTLETVNRIYDRLLESRFNRSCTIVALGGGVVGDMAGFAAATYQRGVAFIQVPTTLLALVDSSVGGKTGVNHPLGKNMIGAFHQPRCVIADTTLLATLPDRELRAGIAEIIKYGLLGDYAFFQWLEKHLGELLARERLALNNVIEQSCRDKAHIVAADERESGQRALLNLGHTFGHAIETAMGYGTWLHGEAVAAGMCMAARVSWEAGWMNASALARVEALIQAAGLPTEPPPIAPERFIELMSVDKKAHEGRLRLVLMEGIGNALVTDAFPPEALERTLTHYDTHRQ
ncbi:MAG TPA: 3-dehydroquinate synthase [Gammaproteobacteria bacterium]|nr:3-dehydroquinate synthase [Gammaproteobacteria bacterium]